MTERLSVKFVAGPTTERAVKSALAPMRGMHSTVIEAVRATPVVVRWQNDTDDELWVEWGRGELDRCTAHDIDLWIVVRSGPATFMETGVFYHHFGDGTVTRCYPVEAITDGQADKE